MKRTIFLVLVVLVMVLMVACTTPVASAIPTVAPAIINLSDTSPTPTPTVVNSSNTTQWVDKSLFELDRLICSAYKKNGHDYTRGDELHHYTEYLLPGESIVFCIADDRSAWLKDADGNFSLYAENIDIDDENVKLLLTTHLFSIGKERDSDYVNIYVLGNVTDQVLYTDRLEHMLQFGKMNEDSTEYPYMVEETSNGFSVLTFAPGSWTNGRPEHRIDIFDFEVEAFRDFYYEEEIYYVQNGDLFTINPDHLKWDLSYPNMGIELIAEDIAFFADLDSVPYWGFENGIDCWGNPATADELEDWINLIWSK